MSITEKQTILVVDDAKSITQFIQQMLEERGYKAIGCGNGADALRLAVEIRPDLIILDIMMPDVDGYAICAQLKADSKTKDIPVIFLSALNSSFDKVKAFKCGAVDYVTKPVQNDELLARVKTHLTISMLHHSLISNNHDLEEKIKERTQNLEIENGAIFSPANRAAQAALLASHAAEISGAPQACAIACEEGESSAAISQALASRGIKSFSAEGEKLSSGEIFDFLKSLKIYCLDRDFFSLESLARKSASLEFLEKSSGETPGEILSAADFYALKKLCPDLASALKFRGAGAQNRAVLSGLKALVDGGGEAQSSQKIARILQGVFSQTRSLDKNISAQAEGISETLAQISAAEKAFGGAGICDTIDALISCADARVFGAVRAPDEVQINN